MENNYQLISYIAPSAPATRRPGTGNEPFLRPEIGFTPKWFHDALGIDFGERWHVDPIYRREAVIAMRTELKKRFPQTSIGGIHRHESPLDLLTGTFGAVTVAGIYGLPLRYEKDKWPVCEAAYLNDAALAQLKPPELENNRFFQNLLTQVERISQSEGRIEGYINWQGILNNAQRLRGQQLFIDLIENPSLAQHLFTCIYATMTDAARQLHARQRKSGVEIGFFTVSNCLVNMLSSDLYYQFLFPYDFQIARSFSCIGIHNCAWNADPYLEPYARIPNVGYIDMGMDSNLKKARKLFPSARRAIMYTPMDLANRSLKRIETDLERIALEYGPCDIVAADIESGTPDKKVIDFIVLCDKLSHAFESTQRKE